MYPWGVERSLGFVAVQARNGTITIPAEARRALRLDLPGAQVEVVLRDHDLVLRPHVAVPLHQVRGDGTASAPGGPRQE
jgi:bifunctional DNA-binding transcriptional regulator/antitoxin component of YhaV-PrlF toxin-antitoxin module